MSHGQTIQQLETTIRGCITRGEYAEAEHLLDQSLDSGRSAFMLRLLQCDLFARTDRAPEAERRLRALHEERPHSQAPLGRLVRLLFQENRIDDARTLFLDALWEASEPVDGADGLVNQLTSGAVDTEATIQFLMRLLATQPSHPVALLRLGVMLARQNRPKDALAAFERSATARPLPVYCLTVRADVLIALGRFEEAIAQARELIALDPSNARYAEKWVIAAAAAGEPTQLARALAQALTACPHDWMLLFRFTRLYLRRSDVQEIFSLIAARAPTGGVDGRTWFHYAMACLEQGQVDTALKALAHVDHSSSANHMARPLRAALVRLKEDGIVAPRIVEDRLRDFELVDVPGATTLLVVFAGLMGRFSYLPLSLLDSYLSRYRTHVVYLRDVRSAAYLDGLPSLGATEHDTQQALRALADRLGATRTITLGTSIGGFAAMRYGARMAADAAVSLAGPSLLNPETDVGPKPAVGRIGKAISMLGQSVDLIDDLQQAPDMLKIYGYNALAPRHVAQMRRHSALPGTLLRPVEHAADHFCALRSVATGLLDQILERDLAIPRS